MIFLAAAIPVVGWLSYTFTGVAGAALAWLMLRSQGAQVWRVNAEGYRAELERARADAIDQVRELTERIDKLTARVTEQDALIKDLQSRTDITPLYAMSKDIQALLHGRTELIERIVASEELATRERAALFGELQEHVFPAIEEIHRSVVKSS